MSSPKSLNVSFIGDASTGKTSVIKSKRQNFENFQVATTLDMISLDVIDSQNDTVHLVITDTGGQERYESWCKQSIRNADVAVILCSYDLAESVENIDNWSNIIEEYAPSNCQKIIVLNKVDIKDHYSNNAEIKQKVEMKAKDNALFFETSASQNIRINELFQRIADCDKIAQIPEQSVNNHRPHFMSFCNI